MIGENDEVLFSDEDDVTVLQWALDHYDVVELECPIILDRGVVVEGCSS